MAARPARCRQCSSSAADGDIVLSPLGNARYGVLTTAERDLIVNGLQQIQTEIEAGTFEWRVDLEDVHMNIEARLTDRIGVTGKKLHTGRSRNDQVATDVRLWLVSEIDLIEGLLTDLQRAARFLYLQRWRCRQQSPHCQCHCW